MKRAKALLGMVVSKKEDFEAEVTLMQYRLILIKLWSKSHKTGFEAIVLPCN